MHTVVINNQEYSQINKNISNILNRLLGRKKIKPTELARLTNLPQPTVQRMVSGTTTKPHLTSLEPIAKFFSISIDQLLGLEPIPWLDNMMSPSLQIRRVPIIEWNDVLSWLNTDIPNLKNVAHENSIISDSEIGPKAFALTVKDASMEPVFNIGTKIIVDPDKTIKDRCFVVVKFFENNETIFRQLIIDGYDYYIKALSIELVNSKLRKITPQNGKICGVLTQTRRDYE